MKRSKSSSVCMVFRKCKCGALVGCMQEENIKDGDVIEHSTCSFKKVKK